MEMTRRQFAVSLAAASFLRSSLFETLSPLGVPRGVVPGRVTGRTIRSSEVDGTGSWWTDANNDQSAIDRMLPLHSLVLQMKKAMPGMELHLCEFVYLLYGECMARMNLYNDSLEQKRMFVL